MPTGKRTVVVAKSIETPASNGDTLVDAYDDWLALPRTGSVLVVSPLNPDTDVIECINGSVIEAFLVIDGSRLPLMHSTTYRMTVSRSFVAYRILLRTISTETTTTLVRFKVEFDYKPRSYSHIKQRIIENASETLLSTLSVPAGEARVYSKI